MLTESADVTSNHWHLIDAGKAKHLCDGTAIMVPSAQIIPQPFLYIRTCSSKSRASYDKGPLFGPSFQHSDACRIGHHCTIKIVGVIFLLTTRMGDIGLHNS